MFAVIAYFWKQWRRTFFSGMEEFKSFAWRAIVATFVTAVVGEILVKIIEHTIFKGVPHAQVEDLFSRLDIIAPALFAAGLLILIAGLRQSPNSASRLASEITTTEATVIGGVQGLCLPFRGFSRSGSTISAAMLIGVPKARAEAFSFALAVILTPPVVVREVLRLRHVAQGSFGQAALPSLLGALFSFFAGLLALRWLSSWLERGCWYYFGIYCLCASVVVFLLHHQGY
jgi:undecaprenyl-diphosphatase